MAVRQQRSSELRLSEAFFIFQPHLTISHHRKTFTALVKRHSSKGSPAWVKMSSRLAFQTQLASIMEVLANAAVAEICKLVDDDYAVVSLQMSQCQRENKALKRKLHLLELKMARGNAERRLRESAMNNSRPRVHVTGGDRLRESASTPTCPGESKRGGRGAGVRMWWVVGLRGTYSVNILIDFLVNPKYPNNKCRRFKFINNVNSNIVLPCIVRHDKLLPIFHSGRLLLWKHSWGPTNNSTMIKYVSFESGVLKVQCV